MLTLLFNQPDFYSQSAAVNVTFTPSSQIKVGHSESITVTFSPAFSRTAKFLQAINIPVTFTVSVQKLIKQSIDIPFTLAVNVQKKVILTTRAIAVTLTVTASESAFFLRSFAIDVIFDPFVDALKIIGSGVTALYGTLRNIKRRIT